MQYYPDPPVEKAVLDHLSRTFPDTIPTRLLAPEDYARLVGQQEVIRHLRGIYDRTTRGVEPAPHEEHPDG